MRALVLAGGEGSRLRPLTHTNAKQLIPVAGTPILFHALEAIRDAGITEVGIVVGPPTATRSARRSATARAGACTSPTSRRTRRSVSRTRSSRRADFVAGQPFLMYLGDNVLLEGLARFVEEFERTRPTRRSSWRACRSRSASAWRCSRATAWCAWSRSRSEYVSDLALVGVYLFDDSILEAARHAGAVVARRVRDHRGDPVADRPRQDGARRDGERMVEGHRQARGPAGGQPDDALDPTRRVEGEVDDASTVEGTVVLARGAKVIRSSCAVPS